MYHVVIVYNYQGEHPVTFSIDGNFGLCRKKAAGTSAQQTHTDKSFFVDQNSVDSFVCQYKGDSSTAKDASIHTIIPTKINLVFCV